MEFKKRRKADSCDVAKCRQRNGIVSTAPDGPKLCPPHMTTWQAEHNLSTGDAAPPSEPPPAETVVEEAAPPAPTGPPGSQESVLAIVEPIRAEAASMVPQLAGLVISSQSMCDKAGALLVATKAKSKALEAERTKVTKPLLDAKKAIDGWFKPAKAALAAVEQALKTGLAGYVTAQEQARIDALQLGNHDAALAVAPAVMPAGVSTRTTWKYEILDPAAIPREYLAIDSAKIQAHVTAHKSQTSIPGIRAYPDTGIAASTVTS